jgi:hypothetical protein
MSKIEVDQVDPQSGTTLTLGTSGDTVSIPSGVTLANAGTATGFSSISWQSTVVTGATHTASAGQGIWINTTSNACTLTLPGSPSVGDELIFSDFARTWGSNAVTLSLNGSKFQGFTSPDPVYDTTGETVHIVYSGSTQGWIPINDGAVALETPQSYSVDFLCIAGGASGGKSNAGGGGAGGYRNSFGSESSGGGGSSETALTLLPGSTYTITIGDGGAATTSNTQNGYNGSDSSISGSGITTITSVGGGFGSSDGDSGGTGGAGGSGGGSSSGNPGGAGTTNQGYAGGTGYSGANSSGGGGGGAGAVGGVGPQSGGGAGGAGLSSSITGSSVARGGGGGGSTENTGSGSAGSAGSGGGGAASLSGNGTAGTVNTGGGGGGTHNGSSSGAGGKGVVILSMPDADYSGTTSGSPTVATGVSGKTVLTFNASGSYTA